MIYRDKNGWKMPIHMHTVFFFLTWNSEVKECQWIQENRQFVPSSQETRTKLSNVPIIVSRSTYSLKSGPLENNACHKNKAKSPSRACVWRRDLFLSHHDSQFSVHESLTNRHWAEEEEVTCSSNSAVKKKKHHCKFIHGFLIQF